MTSDAAGSEHGDVNGVIEAIDNDRRRKDAEALLALFARVTGEPPRLWGPGIIGYGSYSNRLADGQPAEFMRTGFSPRKQNLVLYVGAGMKAQPVLLARLGKHRTGKVCLYLNRLTDVDPAVLEALVRADFEAMNAQYPE